MMNYNILKRTAAVLALSVLVGCGVSGCKANPASPSQPVSSAVSAQAAKDDALLTLNAADSGELPKNFRIVRVDNVKKEREKGGRAANLTGIGYLKMSGSAQFTQKQLTTVLQKIGKQHVTFFDLRQESHGFVNGDAVSYMNKNDDANKGLSDAECAKREKQFLDSIKIGSRLAYTKESTPFTVRTVQNEEQLVKSAGQGYVRLYVTDRQKPSDRNVDDFLAAVRALPQNSWMHFHCMAGQGRTTTFMAMADMLKNAKRVKFDDILYRQFVLGGADLTAGNQVEDWQNRLAFLKEFYTYCTENKDDYKTAWSEWLKTRA